MTSPPIPSGNPSSASAPDMPMAPNGKASVVPPKVSVDNTAFEHEPLPEDKLPLHEDIIQLARLGEISPIQKLFDDGKFDARYRDKEGITPLHVCRSNDLGRELAIQLTHCSGQQSIIITLCANS